MITCAKQLTVLCLCGICFSMIKRPVLQKLPSLCALMCLRDEWCVSYLIDVDITQYWEYTVLGICRWLQLAEWYQQWHAYHDCSWTLLLSTSKWNDVFERLLKIGFSYMLNNVSLKCCNMGKRIQQVIRDWWMDYHIPLASGIEWLSMITAATTQELSCDHLNN